jgi:hypothetical protein
VGLAGVFVAGGMGGESTALGAADKGREGNIASPELEVHLGEDGATRSPSFAGLLLDDSARYDRPSSAVGLEL